MSFTNTQFCWRTPLGPAIAAGLAAAAFTLALTSTATLFGQGVRPDPCAGARDLRLTNGRIVTMDRAGTTVSEVTIQDGRITAVGPRGGQRRSPCTREINLRGRTVVPGLIDNHNHIVLLGIRPGHHTPLEGTASIAEVQSALAARAKGVPAGAFITSMGGWNPAQFAEKRLPTLAELDAAVPNHPVLVFQSFTGPAATNTPGKAFFASKGVTVSDAGAIAANAPSLGALNALRAVQTFEDRKRGTADAMAYSAAVGVTTNVDMGAFNLPGTPDLQGSFEADTLASADQYRMYDAVVALHRERRMTTRLRMFFLTMDTRSDVPMLTQRLRNVFGGFGDDLLRVSGIGEFATSWPLFGNQPPTNYVAALQAVATQGWAFQQHSLSAAENELTVGTFETVNKTTPIADLRWSLAHAGTIDAATINRLKAMGAAIAVHPFQFLAGGRGGPPLRTIVDSGIKVGAGSDSAQISTLNPWLVIAYMVTGKASDGTLINAGQQLTRQEALRLYTAENGWFLKEEPLLGTIEPGKLGDLVVLSGRRYQEAAVRADGRRRARRPQHDELARRGLRRACASDRREKHRRLPRSSSRLFAVEPRCHRRLPMPRTSIGAALVLATALLFTDRVTVRAQQITAWAPKPVALPTYVGTTQPHVKLVDLRARHQSQREWREVVVDDGHLQGEYLQDAPGTVVAKRLHTDSRAWWVVVEGQIRVEIEGQAPFVAVKGSLVQVPKQRIYSMTTTGDGPSLRFAVNIAGAKTLYPEDVKPPSVPGTKWLSVALDRTPAPYDDGNKPHVNLYEAAKAPKYTGGLFVRDQKVRANVIYGHEKDLPPLSPTDKGHYHPESPEFWIVMAGQIRYAFEGRDVFIGEPGDIVYVPASMYHLARFHGPGPSCRLAITRFVENTPLIER
jgi:predicted amidohydrolase YtcJ/quercetin dioxygenase-like cupin family protein